MELIKKPARSVLASALFLSMMTLVSCGGSSDGGGATVEAQAGITAGFSRQGGAINTIKNIAGNSTCANYSWQSRGRAPAGYIQGMALTYARSYCRLRTSEAAPTNLVGILSRAAGNSATDAIALYASNFNSSRMDIGGGIETLRALYTLGTGLGMRESSGKYCEGRDMSASNTSASTAEAGMFQTSYDSMSASSELSNLYAEYQADPSKCFLDVYKKGVSCSTSDLSIAGTGAGANFQAFNKSCPAFAAEYAMVMLRVRRNHYGPINRKEAEVNESCNQMLGDVESFIENDIYSCDEII